MFELAQLYFTYYHNEQYEYCIMVRELLNNLWDYYFETHDPLKCMEIVGILSCITAHGEAMRNNMRSTQ